MDALTWFKSVFRRSLTTPAPLRADVATEMWPDVPLLQAPSPKAQIPPPIPRTGQASRKPPTGPRANPDLVVWGGAKKT